MSWRGATAMGTVHARDLISALNRVETARSSLGSSPLSGVALLFAAGGLTVWATDGSRLALMPVELHAAASVEHLAVVPGGYVSMLKATFDRGDDLELALRGKDTLLARTPGSDRVLAQPLWAPQEQRAAYASLSAAAESEGVVVVRGKDLLTQLRRAAQPLVQLGISVPQLIVHDGEAPIGKPIEITGTLDPRWIPVAPAALADAVDAVTNVKLPNALLELRSDATLRAVGLARPPRSETGTTSFLLRAGTVTDEPRSDATGTPVPAEGRLEEPTVATPAHEILAELDGIIGQPALKQQVRALMTQVEINRKRRQEGLKESQVGAHLVFAGPPGTGKTTVARLIAKLLHALGALEHEEVHETSPTDIVSENVGGTEKNMREAIEAAQGGVLFIDEAYGFTAEKGSNHPGPKAIEALLKAVEDNRAGFVCILAGYAGRMRDFMAVNPGLKSRFPRTIDFVQYSAKELVQIAQGMAKGMDNTISEEGIGELTRRLREEELRGGFERDDWGNARSVRNIVEQAAIHRDMRISLAGRHDRESLVTLTDADIAEACDDLRVGRATGKHESVEEVLSELDAQVGQPQLKQQVRAIVAQVRVQQARQEHGRSAGLVPLEHLLFTGPPGTGKTTIARLMARLYRALGLLTNDGIVEVNQSILVAGYKGQTAIQTREKIDEAMGGVLFIDEAYTLVAGDHSFGQEAIDELLPRLENDKGKFVAIAAGYPDEMKRFVDSNVGLQSRFTTTIEFLPYTTDELVQIVQGMAAKRAEHLTDGAINVLRERLSAVERTGGFTEKTWGNARTVRNVLDRAVQLRDLRISDGDLSADPDLLITITDTDMTAACDREHLTTSNATDRVQPRRTR